MIYEDEVLLSRVLAERNPRLAELEREEAAMIQERAKDELLRSILCCRDLRTVLRYWRGSL